MGLADIAIQDLAFLTGNTNDFGIEITMTAPTGEVAVLNSYRQKIKLPYNALGEKVNTRLASIFFSEVNVPVGYPIKNNKNQVALQGHKFTLKDSAGVLDTWIAREWYPDQTLGGIVVILENFGQD